MFFLKKSGGFLGLISNVVKILGTISIVYSNILTLITEAAPIHKNFNVCLVDSTIPESIPHQQLNYFLDIIFEMYRVPTKLNFMKECYPAAHSMIHMYVSFEFTNHTFRDDMTPCHFRPENLAHAYFPPVFDIHINVEKLFTVTFDNKLTSEGMQYALLKVLLHEFGHAMGLPHSKQANSIMNINPFANYAIDIRDALLLSKAWTAPR